MPSDDSLPEATTIGDPLAEARKVFPLSVTPFEGYMLADDQPDYPMTFVLQFELDGRLEQPPAEAAFLAALHRHPLLLARISHTSGKPCWTLDDPSPPTIDWGGWDDPLTVADEAIRLHAEPGLRAWIRRDDDRTRISLQFHHASTDGLGAYSFFGDWLAEYGRLTTPAGEPAPRWNPLDPALLAQRGLHTPKAGPPAPWHKAAWFLLRETAKMLGRRPRPLSAPVKSQHPDPPTDRQTFPFLYDHTFDPDVSRRLRAAAHAHKSTLNDLLLRDLFAEMAVWNRDQGQTSHRGWLRINMPTSLRERKDDQSPAANLMSYAFLTRGTSECLAADDPASSKALLRSIQIETSLIKEWKLGLLFLEAVKALQQAPGFLPMLLRNYGCFSTAVLSNLGDPTRRFTSWFPRRDGLIQAGNLRLTRLFGPPPLRPGTRASLACYYYADRLTLVLRIDPTLFPPSSARRFLTRYAARLEHSAR